MSVSASSSGDAIFTSPPSDAYVAPGELDGVPVYRSISAAAVMSVVLGVLGLLGLFIWPVLILAAAGFLLGVVGYHSIRRYPDEYAGMVPAVLGMTLCGLVVVGGTAWHGYVYATEVPEGAERISFATLNPDDRNAPAVPPERAVALDGKRVFIKGYVYPDGQSDNIKQFVLIPDLGTCCFGGQPKLTDMILVTLRDPHRTYYNQRKRKLTGVLKVDTSLKPVSGVTGVYYQLDAEWIQ